MSTYFARRSCHSEASGQQVQVGHIPQSARARPPSSATEAGLIPVNCIDGGLAGPVSSWGHCAPSRHQSAQMPPNAAGAAE